ncbi:MAG: integral rane sensor signal transduction histidine kinase [Solirubrobacterales bacterium]|nr:integral rane sensor signal transduction histidine kinase [Solirubrobacterales bacterium]
MNRVPLRWRLAGAFTVVSAVVLLVVGVFLHARMRAELDSSLRSGLRQRAADLTLASKEGTPDLGTGTLVERGDDLAQVLDARGAIVAGAPGLTRVPLLTPEEVRLAARGPLEIDARDVGDEQEPAALLAASAGGRVVVVGASLEDRDEALGKLDGLLLIVLPAGLLIAALAGAVVARRGLEPIERMRRRAEAIGADDLSTRLPVPIADDEVRRLAQTLNGMLGRLETGMERERTFVADASHELRGPLAALRAELELAQRAGRSPAELRAAIGSAAEETERLVRMAEDLLVVARADAGGLPLRVEQVALGPVLKRIAARAAAPLEVHAPEGLVVTADPLRLEQAIGNLVDNAARHGAPPITVRASREEDGVHLEVLDRGQGLPAELADRAFERFTRGDTARDRAGTGLGLAIVAAIADAHGWDVRLTAAEGGGTSARIDVPTDVAPGDA